MIGAVLKTYREKQGFGVREMAAWLEISPATLSRIERGHPMDSATMLKLIWWLFGRYE